MIDIKRKLWIWSKTDGF